MWLNRYPLGGVVVSESEIPGRAVYFRDGVSCSKGDTIAVRGRISSRVQQRDLATYFQVEQPTASPLARRSTARNADNKKRQGVVGDLNSGRGDPR